MLKTLAAMNNLSMSIFYPLPKDKIFVNQIVGNIRIEGAFDSFYWSTANP